MRLSRGGSATADRPATDTAIPGRSLILILLAFCCALPAHMTYLPLWFWGPALLVIGWRAGVWLGYLHFPRLLARILVLTLATIAVLVATGASLTLETSTAFLLATAFMKLLELAKRRDAVVMLLLTLFIQATGFLYNQGILITLNGILTVWLTSAAMLSVQATHRRGVPGGLPVFRQSAVLLLLALPLMLFAYVLFPRVGPLWSVPLQTESAFTGLSHSMSPGDISRLSESDDLAFRVTFEGTRPQREELYWRALVMADYDGRAWHSRDREGRLLTPAENQSQADPDALRYEVIAEPNGQLFLYSLAGVRARSPGTGLTPEGLLASTRPLMQRFRYLAESNAGRRPEMLNSTDRAMYLALPGNTNPRLRQWAAGLASQSADSSAFALAMMRYFGSENFVYTLSPPVYGQQDLDEMMFDQRRGFCAHFASAMVFAARAAGYPARIVTGYQGGEWSPEGYLSVRQYDAHAWTEIWTGNAWQRYDPTAMVAPDRISLGLEQALAQEGSFLQQNLLSPHRYRNVAWLNDLRQRMENMNYYWTRWVLSYDREHQMNLLRDKFGMDDITRAVYLLAAALVTVMVVATLILWWLQRPEASDQLVREWRLLRAQARRSGIAVQNGESPLTLLRRIGQLDPLLAGRAADAGQLAEACLYRPEGGDRRALISSLRGLRRVLRPVAEAPAASDIHKRAV